MAIVNFVAALAGIVAAVAGVGAWVVASRARRDEHHSAAAAEAGNRQVLAATGRVEVATARVEAALARAEARALERNDVDWSVDHDPEGGWRLTNTGQDPAHDVSAWVCFNDSHTTVSAKLVEPGGFLPLPDLEEPEPDVTTTRIPIGPYGSSDISVPNIHFDSWWQRISWRTPGGAWSVDDHGGPWG